MFVVDTNVFVYAANSATPEHVRCRELLDAWRSGAEPWSATWSSLYEFVRIVTHPRVLAKPLTAAQAWSFVQAIVASPSFRILGETDRHTEIGAQTIADVPLLAGNIIHDLHTAVVMREHGVSRIQTRDADFHRFPFLDVVDPMAPDRVPERPTHSRRSGT